MPKQGEDNMPKYHCLYADCNEYKKVVEDSSTTHNCSECGRLMVSAAQPQNPNFSEQVKHVNLAMGKKYKNSYQKAVIDDVGTRPYFFKQDFINEMKRGIEFDRFIGKTKRPDSKDKDCVDNALKAAKYAFPGNHPKGEKYTFEVPYIMKRADWDFINKDNDIFKSNFKMLENKVSPNSVYLVLTKKSFNEIGHMIVLAVKSKNEAFVCDAQKQPTDYSLYEYVAWKSKQELTSIPVPYRPIDLSTGKFSKGKGWLYN